MKIRYDFDFLGRTCMFLFQAIRKPTTQAEGIASNILGTPYHVLMLDYDYIYLEFVKQEVAALIEIFSIGSCHIFQTRENAFHVYCMDYFTASEVIEIQKTSNCDRNYIKGPLLNKHRGWVLRCSTKGTRGSPRFVETIHSPFDGDRMQSSWHCEMLNRVYSLELQLSKPDGLFKGIRDIYLTSERKDVK